MKKYQKFKTFFKHKRWRIVKRIIGVILIVTGIVGIFLPFIQGLLLVAVGIYLVGNHKLINWLKQNIVLWKRQLKNWKNG